MRSRLVLFAAALALAASFGRPAAAQGGPATEEFKFQVAAGEKAKFGFVVSQPGEVNVSVSSEGAPLTVTLTGPEGTEPVRQQGAGNLQLKSEAKTPAGQTQLWYVSVSAGGKAQEGRAPERAAAAGTVTVQHPAGDKQAAEQLFAPLRARRGQQFNASKAQFEQQARATVQQALQERRRLVVKEAGDRLAADKSQSLARLRATGAAAGNRPNVTVGTGADGRPTFTSGGQSGGTSGSPGAGSPGAAGNSAGSTVSTPAGGGSAAPVINSLDRREGSPGTPVIITGSGFGTGMGEVHFIVAQGQDLAAPVEPGTWSDTQVMAYVPDVSGVQAFDGQVYVSNGSQRSALQPFHFSPATEVVAMPVTINGGDCASGHIDAYDSCSNYNSGGPDPTSGYGFHSGGAYTGSSHDDIWNAGVRLKNGWVVDSVPFSRVNSESGEADSLVTSTHVNTDDASVTVHWWNTPWDHTSYYVSVLIRGPKGVPYK